MKSTNKIVSDILKEAGNLKEIDPDVKSKMDSLFNEHDNITLTETIAEIPITIKIRPIDIIAEFSAGSGFGKTPDSQYDPIAEAVRATIQTLGYDPGPLSRAESGLQDIGKRTYEVSDYDIAKIIERLRPEYITPDVAEKILQMSDQTPQI